MTPFVSGRDGVRSPLVRAQASNLTPSTGGIHKLQAVTRLSKRNSTQPRVRCPHFDLEIAIAFAFDFQTSRVTVSHPTARNVLMRELSVPLLPTAGSNQFSRLT